jgi:nitroreductase
MHEDAFFDVLRSRRSVRAFTDRLPDQTLLDRLIEAAQWAPSNHNRQGWKFLVFRDKAQIRELSEKVHHSLCESLASANRLLAAQGHELLHFATLFDKAPVIILAMHKKSPAIGRALLGPGGSGCVSSEALSTAMAVQNLLLAAHVLRLGACAMTAPLLAREVWESIPDLPAGFEPTCLVAVGYPAEKPSPPRRKSIGHIVEYR